MLIILNVLLCLAGDFNRARMKENMQSCGTKYLKDTKNIICELLEIELKENFALGSCSDDEEKMRIY